MGYTQFPRPGSAGSGQRQANNRGEACLRHRQPSRLGRMGGASVPVVPCRAGRTSSIILFLQSLVTLRNSEWDSSGLSYGIIDQLWPGEIIPENLPVLSPMAHFFCMFVMFFFFSICTMSFSWTSSKLFLLVLFVFSWFFWFKPNSD